MSDAPRSKMRPVANINLAMGSYRNQDGEDKTRWLQVGTVFKSEDGKRTSIKLDAIPVKADWDGWLAVFPRQKREDAPTPAAASSDSDELTGPIDLDDIPF